VETVRIQLFENRSYANMKMLATCLDNISVSADGRLAYSWLDQASMRRYAATAADCHNLVNELLSLSGVQMGILFEEFTGYVKVSFRCRRGYRVDTLARRFGGGGHPLAAGCKLSGDLSGALAVIIPVAQQLLRPETT
jgi:phosphoesterase RecJ-like protein